MAEIVGYGSGINTTTASKELIFSNPWSTKQHFRAPAKIINLKNINTLFIYNINTEKTVNLKLVPDSLSEKYSQKIISQAPFGILHPLNFYVGGSTKVLDTSFVLHEDVTSVNNSIYRLVELIKSMSMPISKDGQLLPPLVYFQLGDQFAGKGHMSTSFTYKKPYAKGRYKIAECNLTFTFHEIFDNPQVIVSSDDMTVSAFSSSSIGLDLSGTEYANMSISDFYEEYLDYDYLITNSYIEDKLNNVLNIISNSIPESKKYYMTTDELSTALASDDKEALYNTLNNYASSYNPFLAELIGLYIDLFNILDTATFATYHTVYYSLNTLKENINTLKTYFESTRIPDSENLFSVTYIGDVYKEITLSDKEITSFYNTLEDLLKIVEDQIDIYKFLEGAGS